MFVWENHRRENKGSLEMEELLERLIHEYAPYTKEGVTASYISELSKVDPDALGIHLISLDGKHSLRANNPQVYDIEHYQTNPSITGFIR